MTLHTNWHTNLQKTSLNISVSCHIFYFSNSIFLRWSNACFLYIYFNHVINKLPAESKQKVKSKHCLTTTRSNLLFNYFFFHHKTFPPYFRTAETFDLRRLWRRQENYIDNNKHETEYLTRIPVSQFYLSTNGRDFSFPFLQSLGKKDWRHENW